MNNIAIIIQARTKSTRLPNKITKPFFEKKNILEIIIEKLKKLGYEIFIATTIDPSDNIIEKIAHENNVKCFRGDQENVLSRFITICEENKLTHAIRVCSDNPFISVNFIQNILSKIENIKTIDYVGYFDNKDQPMILSHYGFFSELISLNAMLHIQNMSKKSSHFEHVTNFIYENPNQFKILKIETDKLYNNYKKIRLTVDNKIDFEIISFIFSSYKGNHESHKDLINYILNRTNFINKMSNNIKNNKK